MQKEATNEKTLGLLLQIVQEILRNLKQLQDQVAQLCQELLEEEDSDAVSVESGASTVELV